MKKINYKLYILFITLLLLIVITGCASSVNNSKTNDDVQNSIQTTNIKNTNNLNKNSDKSNLDAEPDVIIDITAFRFGFEPSTISVKQGQKVRINFKSLDVPHGFAINEYAINLYADGLSSTSVEFIADKKGIFDFFCSVPCGSGHGSMRGQLIVQ